MLGLLCCKKLRFIHQAFTREQISLFERNYKVLSDGSHFEASWISELALKRLIYPQYGLFKNLRVIVRLQILDIESA